MASQNLWRGVRTAVAVLFTAGLSVAALYTWFIHKQRSKDKTSKRALSEIDENGKEDDDEQEEESTKEDPKQERNNKIDVVKASGDNGEKKVKGKPTVPTELPQLEIATKILDNNEASQPEKKSPDIKSLRIDSTDKKRVLVLGLDKAGKSTFVSALCGRQVQVDYAPTQGFAVVTTTIGNKALNFWEVGGALNLRQHWDHYIEGTQVLIYIIDSSSLDTVNVAKVELWSLVEANKYLETIPWLIIASKQDLPGAMSPEELRELLNIPQVPKKPEKIVIGMELPAKGLKKGITKVKNFFTLTDF